jgi:hypothetical protein
MPHIRFLAMPTAIARTYQAGGLDAYGHKPERRISDGDSIPCRHCLCNVETGAEYLILAHRPFSNLQPYAETGPIFLHAKECARHPETEATPEMFLTSQTMMVRGYSEDQRIVYGTGTVVPSDRIAETAAALLERPGIAFVHLRSARNNCFQCRIERR